MKTIIKNLSIVNISPVLCAFPCVLLITILLPSCTNQSVKNANSDTEIIEIIEDYRVDSNTKNNFNKAVKLLNQHKYEEAIVLLNTITKTTKTFTAPYINLGIAYSKINKLEEAEQNFVKALKLNPEHPLAKNELATIYRKTGNFSKAKSLYEEVLNSYSYFHPARKNLGILCDLYLQDLNCASKQYELYLSANPNDKNMKIWMADVKNRIKYAR